MAAHTPALTALASLIALGCGAGVALAAPPQTPALTLETAPPRPRRATRRATRPETRAELLDRALTALARGDAKAYLALLPTLSELVAHCPEEARRRGRPALKQQLEVLRAATKDGVARCAALFDWSKATRVEVVGGEAEHEEGCAGIAELEDFLVVYAVGDERYRVKLDEPFVLGGGGYGFNEGPRCRALE